MEALLKKYQLRWCAMPLGWKAKAW